MSDIQAAIFAATILMMIGMFLLYQRDRRFRGRALASKYEPLCDCARRQSRHFALKQLFYGLSAGQLLTDNQVDQMAGAVDEMMQIWATKPDLTIVQASSHLIAVRLAAERNIEVGRKRAS